MRGEALRALGELAGTGVDPTDAQAKAAIGEGIDILLTLVSLVERIAVALETIATPEVTGQELVRTD